MTHALAIIGGIAAAIVCVLFALIIAGMTIPEITATALILVVSGLAIVIVGVWLYANGEEGAE